MGTNQTLYHDEIVSAEIGQVGTQFDGLGHIGIGDLFYNGNNRREFAKAEVHEARHRERRRDRDARRADRRRGIQGRPLLAGGYEITLADVQAALKQQSIEIRAGDIVLVHTGWGSLWLKDNAKFTARAPGIGLEAARYLVEREVVMVGSDTWATEVVPNPNPSYSSPCTSSIPRNGIYIFENLRPRSSRATASTSSRSSSRR